jgi:hypothetical protein
MNEASILAKDTAEELYRVTGILNAITENRAFENTFNIAFKLLTSTNEIILSVAQELEEQGDAS